MNLSYFTGNPGPAISNAREYSVVGCCQSHYYCIRWGSGRHKVYPWCDFIIRFEMISREAIQDHGYIPAPVFGACSPWWCLEVRSLRQINTEIHFNPILPAINEKNYPRYLETQTEYSSHHGAIKSSLCKEEHNYYVLHAQCYSRNSSTVIRLGANVQNGLLLPRPILQKLICPRFAKQLVGEVNLSKHQVMEVPQVLTLPHVCNPSRLRHAYVSPSMVLCQTSYHGNSRPSNVRFGFCPERQRWHFIPLRTNRKMILLAWQHTAWHRRR